MSQFDKLPEGWIKTTIGESTEILDRLRVPLNAKERSTRQGAYPYYGANGQVDSIDDYIFNGEYTLIAEDGGHFDALGKAVAYRVEGMFWVNNHAHIVQSLAGMSAKFLTFSFNSKNWMPYVSGTTRLKLTQASLKEVPLNLPPLNEQRRIVEKIEALTARSRRAREALGAIPELLDQFRQSVLAAAFRGDLTADWRAQNPDVEPAEALLERIRVERRRRWEAAELKKMRGKGKEPKNNTWKEKYKEPIECNAASLLEIPEIWCWANASEIGDSMLGKMLDKSKHQSGKLLPYLRNLNVRWGSVDLSDVLDMYFEENEYERYSIKKGDILICEGGEPGRAAVWEGGEEFKYQKAIHRLRPFQNINPHYIVYHLWFDAQTGNLERHYTGSTIKHFTGVSLAKYPIRLPSVREQNEIVARISKLLALASSFADDCVENVQGLDQLDRAILAKAFRGELVPQDPTDEPAALLLDRIRTEREKSNSKGKIQKAKKQT